MPRKSVTKTIKAPKMKELTAENLKQDLWETLQSIKSGDVGAREANAIARQSTEICRIQKVQLEAAKLMGKMTKVDAKKLLLK